MQISPRITFLLGLAAGLVAVVPPVRAEEPPSHPATTASEAREAEPEEPANELALFLGGTSEDDRTHFTIGAEYGRRLGERIGLGVVAEHVDGLDSWVFVAPFSLPARPNPGAEALRRPGLRDPGERARRAGARGRSGP